MEISGNSIDHLNFFLKKIENNEPFSIIRPNDGEFSILKGKHFVTQDRWYYKGGTLQQDLFDAIVLAVELPNSYVGIPCFSCWNNGNTQWYIDTFNIPKDKLTYGNIVCNKNWKIFTNYLIEKFIPFYYIGPGKKDTDKLNVTDKYLVDEFQIHRWDSEKDKFLEDCVKWVEDKLTTTTGVKLFLISAGPLSKVLIPKLFKIYNTHQFIDCGSSLDLFLKGSTNRLYINENDKYSNLVCDFTKGHTYL